jgi:hypothetical protein
MMSWMVTIAREAVLDVLDALDNAIELAKHHSWFVDQIRFEDAYQIVRDALFPALPDS